MKTDLTGVELAKFLANRLNDLEFEMLVRTRIEQTFEMIHKEFPGLDESKNECSFTYYWHDKASWRVSVGSNYKDQTNNRGEVLSMSVSNAAYQYAREYGNRLSVLLPAPETTRVAEAEESQRLLDADEF